MQCRPPQKRSTAFGLFDTSYCGRDSVDVNRVCSARMLEKRPNQGLGTEHRSSLAGAIPPDTVIRRHLLSLALPARPIAVRVRNTGGLGRHRYCYPGIGRGWRNTH